MNLAECRDMSGATTRQIDHWSTYYFRNNPGSGNRRTFSIELVLGIRALKFLSDLDGGRGGTLLKDLSPLIRSMSISELTQVVHIPAKRRVLILLDLTVEESTEPCLYSYLKDMELING
jgi:hypothetical protein